MSSCFRSHFGSRRLVAVLVAAACVLATGAMAGADTMLVDFEEPTYTPGVVPGPVNSGTGQDGWQGKEWDASGNLEDSVASATGAIAGSQSLVYTQALTSTGENPGFGSGGFDDINRGYFPGFAPVTDGGAAIDVTATWIMKADVGVNGIDFGLYVSDVRTSTDGQSPFGMRIQNRSIQYLVAGDADPPGPWADSGAGYVPGDVWEFKLDIDLDNRVSELFGRNDTAGDGEFTSLSGGLVPVWDDGLPIGVEVYVGLALRGGIGTIDNIQIEMTPGPVIPEPGTLALLLLAAPIGLGFGRRRRSRA